MAANGDAEVLQRNHYYPFGLRVESPSFQNLGDPANRYLYNGKELQTDLGMGWLYYGARMYDPAYGRFTGVDPLADSYAAYTPYHYVLGNPLRFVDPDGMRVEDTYGVDSYGKIHKINDDTHYDVNGNEVDILITGTALSDKMGKREKQLKSGIEIQSGALEATKIMDNKMFGRGQVTDLSKSGIDREEGQKIFEFLANNSEVEFSYFGDENGKLLITTSMTKKTSHAKASDSFGTRLAQRLRLTFHDHSHPGAGNIIESVESLTRPSKPDRDFKSDVLSRHNPENQTPIFRIYTSRRYFPY